MTIPVRCSNCRNSWNLRDEFAGRSFACPVCGAEFVAGEAPGNAGEPPSVTDEMLAAPDTITADMFAPAESLPAIPPHPEDGRHDFERGMPMAPALTLGLIVAITVVFILQVSGGSLESKESIIQAGALSRDHVLGRAGTGAPEVWRLVSAMFLHGSIDHLIGNALALYVLGLACEHAFGFGGLAGIYFLSGIGGSLMSIAMGPGPSVGASGAIFGLMGAAVVFFRKYASLFVLRDSRVGWVLLAWAGYSVATGLLQPYVDNGAHIGGFLSGAAIAAVVPPAILKRLPASQSSS